MGRSRPREGGSWGGSSVSKGSHRMRTSGTVDSPRRRSAVPPARSESNRFCSVSLCKLCGEISFPWRLVHRSKQSAKVGAAHSSPFFSRFVCFVNFVVEKSFLWRGSGRGAAPFDIQHSMFDIQPRCGVASIQVKTAWRLVHRSKQSAKVGAVTSYSYSYSYS